MVPLAPPAPTGILDIEFIVFLTKVYLEEMERHHFSSCQFPPLFLKTISQGELKKTNL